MAVTTISKKRKIERFVNIECYSEAGQIYQNVYLNKPSEIDKDIAKCISIIHRNLRAVRYNIKNTLNREISHLEAEHYKNEYKLKVTFIDQNNHFTATNIYPWECGWCMHDAKEPRNAFSDIMDWLARGKFLKY